MSDYKDIFRTTETQNWFKCSLAVLIAREGLVDLAKDEIGRLHSDIIKSVIQTNNLKEGTECSSCSTLDVVPCPTRGTCQIRQGRCSFHKRPFRSCPNKICGLIRQDIEKEHQFSLPSWKNTDAKKWFTRFWEVGKCFLPPDGYAEVVSADDTDFNGVISVLINCKRFHSKFSDDLANATNVCTKAREVGRAVRHCADLKMAGSIMSDNIDALVKMLEDPKFLLSDAHAMKARDKLKMLKNDSLIVTSTDLQAVLELVLNKTTQSAADQMEKALEKKIQEFKSRMNEIKNERETQSLQSETERYQILKNELRKDLAYFYQQRQSSMPLSPLLPEVDDKLSKFYISPNLSRLQPKHEERICLFKSLFEHENKVVHNCYVQGEAGMGKSTFCAKLALLWSEIIIDKIDEDSRKMETSGDIKTFWGMGSMVSTFIFAVITLLWSFISWKNTRDSDHKEKTENTPGEGQPTKQNRHDTFTDSNVISEFEFVFSIALRDAKGKCDIETMINNQLVSSLGGSGNYDALVRDILTRERCLIILDGLDEWTHHTCGKSENIPHRKLWKSTTILTTTRPWKINDARVKSSDMDVLIEITGMSDRSAFIQNVLKCLNEKYQKSMIYSDFIDKIKTETVEHFLDIPLVLLQVLCLWHEGREFGKSKCEIYSNMSDMMFARASDKATIDSSDSSYLTELDMPRCFRRAHSCQRHRDLLGSLGSLAFHTLHSSDKETRLVFPDAVVTDHILSENNCQKAYKIGILSQQSAPSLTARRYNVSFVHKTFQEFLAAYFLATNSTESENAMETVVNVYKSAREAFNISQILLFVCGMNPKVAFTLSEKIMKCFTLFNQSFTSDAICTLQAMFIEGYKEGVMNGHHDLNLALYHIAYSYRVSKNDKIYLDKLVELNKDKIVTFYLIPGIGMLFGSDSIMAPDQKMVQNKSPGGFSVTQNTGSFPLNSLLQFQSPIAPVENAPTTTDLTVRTLVCKVMPTFTHLQTIHIEDADLGDINLSPPNTVQAIQLNSVKLTSRSCQQLVDRVAELHSEVGCVLYKCVVNPQEEYDDIIKVIETSGKFTINKISDTILMFTKKEKTSSLPTERVLYKREQADV